MGSLFTLDDDTKSVIREALDDLISEFGKDCLLVYPAVMRTCANCVFDPLSLRSSGRWKTGGPVWFSTGTCPLCRGEGRRAEESSETLRMLCAWEAKSFFYPVPGVDLRAPYSLLQTKCFLRDAPKLMRCDHLVFQAPDQGLVRKKFKLLGQPGDASNIIQGRYCIASWEQAS